MELALKQPEGLEAAVAGLADHDVVVHRDAELGRGLLDLAGHLDVGLRRRGVAGRVVVHQDERRGAELRQFRIAGQGFKRDLRLEGRRKVPSLHHPSGCSSNKADPT